MEVFGKLRLTDHIEGKRGREKHSLTFVANYVNGYQNRERGVEKETNIAECYKGKEFWIDMLVHKELCT